MLLPPLVPSLFLLLFVREVSTHTRREKEKGVFFPKQFFAPNNNANLRQREEGAFYSSDVGVKVAKS